MRAQQHPGEVARLALLRSYDILDTPPEEDFDEIVRLVAAVCGMPISVVTLVESDRQWFKAKVGLDLNETPLDVSVCAHGILQPDLLEIPDMTKDVRTIDNPLVKGAPHARFYAGAALTGEDGLPLGMLCVLDYQPRQLTETQRDLLRVMARLVMQQIELRRALQRERAAHAVAQEVLEKTRALAEHNAILRHEIDHRAKNSLTQVAAFLRLQERKHKDEPTIAEALAEARNRVVTVASVHDHLHRAAAEDKISVAQFLANLTAAISLNRPPQLKSITVDAEEALLPADKVLALGLAVNELVSNAMKHAFLPADEGVVTIAFRRLDGDGELRVCDNGRGVPEGFQFAGTKGLGLRVLGSLAGQLGGAVRHESSAQGANFILRFPLEHA